MTTTDTTSAEDTGGRTGPLELVLRAQGADGGAVHRAPAGDGLLLAQVRPLPGRPELSLVLQQVMVVGVLAIGQTLVILTAGIDLSVGTVMALGQVVMTKLAIENGMSPFLAIALGLLVCVAFGVLNGSLVTLVRLPAFIVTLGTLNIAFALTHIVSNDLTFPGLPRELLFFGRTFAVGGANFTYGVVFMLVLYAIAWFSLTQTAWGVMSTPSATTPKPRV